MGSIYTGRAPGVIDERTGAFAGLSGRSINLIETVENPLGLCNPLDHEGQASSNKNKTKMSFAIDKVMERLRVAVGPFPKAALFELAEDGFDSVFEQLVACILSIRTRDETTIVVARRLFSEARTPESMLRLGPDGIGERIASCSFHAPKARQIHAIAERAAREFGGQLPCDLDVLLSFQGVGPKCANLALGIACGQALIGVDIHVHRVTNRWGYVKTRNPDQTLAALTEKLPRAYWVEINRLLVPFGKHICTGVRPKCSTCPVLEFCEQVGVEAHR